MNNFLNKVRAERAVLNLVNRRFGFIELSGLSASAIEEWAPFIPDSAAIVDGLQRLSEMIGALSERSGEHFNEAHLADSSAIEGEIAGFERLLASTNPTKRKHPWRALAASKNARCR